MPWLGLKSVQDTEYVNKYTNNNEKHLKLSSSKAVAHFSASVYLRIMKTGLYKTELKILENCAFLKGLRFTYSVYIHQVPRVYYLFLGSVSSPCLCSVAFPFIFLHICKVVLAKHIVFCGTQMLNALSWNS